MIAVGTMVEIGQLEDEGGSLGFVIERQNGEFITIKGLTLDEARAAAQLLFESATITLVAGAPP